MKALKPVIARNCGFVIAALVAIGHSAAMAQVVTGSNLNIGLGNGSLGPYASVAGGISNSAAGYYSVVAGGGNNSAAGWDSSVAGGVNNRIGSSGNYSFIGAGEDNYLSSPSSFIGSGVANTNTGSVSVIGGGMFNAVTYSGGTIGGGRYNITSALGATVPGGLNANASLYGQFAHASGKFSQSGDAQTSEYVMRAQSTTNSAQLFLDGSGALLTVPANGAWAFEITVIAEDPSGNSAAFKTDGLIKNIGGSTSLIGGPIALAPYAADPAASAWSVSLYADTVNNALTVVGNSDASTNRWVATVRTTEVSQ